MVIVEGDKENCVHDGEDHRREQGAAQDELEPGVRDGVLGLAWANTNLKRRGELLKLDGESEKECLRDFKTWGFSVYVFPQTFIHSLLHTNWLSFYHTVKAG